MRKKERDKIEGSNWWHIRDKNNLLLVEIIAISDSGGAIIYSTELDLRMHANLEQLHETKQEAIAAAVKQEEFYKGCVLNQIRRYRNEAKQYDRSIARIRALKPYEADIDE